jgi:hypothetical protein
MAIVRPAFLSPLKLGAAGQAYSLILNAPERRNALGRAMVESLQQCVEELTGLAPWECRGVLIESHVKGDTFPIRTAMDSS